MTNSTFAVNSLRLRGIVTIISIRHALAALAGASLSVLVGGCSTGTTKIQEPPSTGEYTLTFQNTQFAAITGSVKLYVFDSSQPNIECGSLLATRRTGQPLPEAPVLVFESPTFATCDLLHRVPSTRITIGYGARTILAVGSRGGRDATIGCGAGTVEAGSEPITVLMAAFDPTAALPPTTCTKLSDLCDAKTCK